MLIGAVALIIVGPQRLPGMLGTLGKWSNKLRRMLFDVRQQSGIDEILRAEGITGGLKEIRDLRNAVRGNVAGLLTVGSAAPPRQGVQQTLNQTKAATPAAAPTPVVAPPPEVVTDPYADVPYDRSREYPDEGCDAYGTIPDDLWAAAHPQPKPQSTVPNPTAAEPSVADAALPRAAFPVAAGAVADAVNTAATTAPTDESPSSATDTAPTHASPTDALTPLANDESVATPVAETDDTTLEKAAETAPQAVESDAPEAEQADRSPDTDSTVS